MSSLSTFTVYICPSPWTKNWKEETWHMLFEKAKGKALFKVELWNGTNDPGTGTERRVRVGVNPFNFYVMYMKSRDLVALRAAWHPSSKQVADTTGTVLPFWRNYPDKNGAKKAGAKIAALSDQDRLYGSDTWETIQWTHLAAFSYGAFAKGEELEAKAAMFLQHVQQDQNSGKPVIQGETPGYPDRAPVTMFDFKKEAGIQLTVHRIFGGNFDRLTSDETSIVCRLDDQWWNTPDAVTANAHQIAHSPSSIAQTYPWFAPYLKYTATIQNFSSLFPNSGAQKICDLEFDLFSLYRPTYFESQLDLVVLQEFVAEQVAGHGKNGVYSPELKEAWFQFNDPSNKRQPVAELDEEEVPKEKKVKD
ncbi:hypothetical protein K438DRAFT_1976257 [Mycena galopus ATCC 62051]|nr:hypothetical protein K438DRAFT_1976257 [Mycena galopus ATCC 62051]